MAVQLTVTSGPEAGKRAFFSTSLVTLGRAPDNDFVLQDGLISSHHGELVRRDDQFFYRDLRSRHGTRVKVNHVTVNLHDRGRIREIALPETAELMLGETLVSLEIKTTTWEAAAAPQRPPRPRPRPEVQSNPPLASIRQPSLNTLRPDRNEEFDDHILKRTHDSVDAVAKRLSQKDPRLVSIFRLSRELNSTAEMDELLNLISQTTFEAFPAANFFAISVREEGSTGNQTMRPLISRERHVSRDSKNEPLLSHSLLEKVAESRESVLFVRDSAGRELTESIINARIMACMAAPLVGQNRLLGVMQADTRGLGGLFGPEDLDLFTVMASYAAFAIERIRLNKSIYEMFEGIVFASVSAIDSRDPTTAGHSERVADYTIDLAQEADRVGHGPLSLVRFSENDLTELRYAALLHDFGKIGVRESVLGKGTRLPAAGQREIHERFQQVKAIRAGEMRRSLLQDLAQRHRPPDEALLERLEADIRRVHKELDEILAFLMS
ncbi:MAG: FHA domain-containing protein, partial [Myxococcales bacterium]|nr:FHA domain-containing protein [Myxococcales bacterium]